jgi:thiamine-monophosphate kinase
MALSEFELIRRYFYQAARPGQGVAIGIGDDCALLDLPTDKQMAVSMDTLVSGVHFPENLPPRDLGYRVLAVNLSDLAAMGAEPAWFTLGLTLPEVTESWLQPFAEGLAQLAQQANIALVGGDTTRGPLNITLQVAGYTDIGAALCRSGASPGDLICVTGTLGDAAAGLAQWQHPEPDTELRQRLARPTPRLKESRLLRSVASACIDISDGLLADLSHLLTSSGVGAEVQLAELPMSSALQTAGNQQQQRGWALAGGDDYELCFTLPATKLIQLQTSYAEAGCGFSVIGRISSEPGLRCLEADGRRYTPAQYGYEHFV